MDKCTLSYIRIQSVANAIELYLNDNENVHSYACGCAVRCAHTCTICVVFDIHVCAVFVCRARRVRMRRVRRLAALTPASLQHTLSVPCILTHSPTDLSNVSPSPTNLFLEHISLFSFFERVFPFERISFHLISSHLISSHLISSARARARATRNMQHSTRNISSHFISSHLSFHGCTASNEHVVSNGW